MDDILVYEYDVVAQDRMRKTQDVQMYNGRHYRVYSGRKYELRVEFYPDVEPPYQMRLITKPRKKNASI